MLIKLHIHQLPAEAAMTAAVNPCWKFVSSDQRRPDYGLTLAERCAR